MIYFRIHLIARTQQDLLWPCTGDPHDEMLKSDTTQISCSIC